MTDRANMSREQRLLAMVEARKSEADLLRQSNDMALGEIAHLKRILVRCRSVLHTALHEMSLDPHPQERDSVIRRRIQEITDAVGDA